MNISLKTFGGLMPRIDPTLLQDSAATVANNCRLRSGKCSPLKQSAAFDTYKVRLENGLTDMADAKTLHLWKRGERKEFLAWPGHVTTAPSNIFDDMRHRVFVAGETGVTGTQVATPPKLVFTPAASNIKFVVVYSNTASGECSLQTANYNIRQAKGVASFSEESLPSAATWRQIYKVVSVDGTTATLVTQDAWKQEKGDAWVAFGIFVDDTKNLTSVTKDIISTGDTSVAPVLLSALSDPLDPPEVPPVPTGHTYSFFVQTYVDYYGRESLPSVYSDAVIYIPNQTPLWIDAVSAISGAPTNVLSRRIYKVVGIYGEKIYVVTKSAWQQAKVGSDFPAWNLTHDKTTDGAKQTLYFTDQFVNQPCVYVSAIDSGGFDRHPICLEQLPTCEVTRVDGNITVLTDARYTVFFQTWVDEYGYESPCSEPSAEAIYNDGDTMTIPVMTVIPPGAAKRRIYKVVTGTEESSIQFVWEQDAINNQFATATFTVKDEDAGEQLVNMTQCPKDLCWIVGMPGNFYAGFATGKKRQICFSEIEIPTSWPDAYRYDIREDAVGLAVSGTTLFVMTVGQPYAISGTDPNAMTSSRIASNQGCVSKYSICTMNNAVFYASQDGVCMLSEGNQSETVLTTKLFSKAQWTALNPSSCLMVAHDAALHMFFEKTDGTRVAYMLDMIDGTPVLTTHDDVASAVFADVESDGLYMIKEVSP
jgi:hypothetical protein